MNKPGGVEQKVRACDLQAGIDSRLRRASLRRPPLSSKKRHRLHGQHVPASHNNHGVMLARMGLLKKPKENLRWRLKTSDGRLADAAHNLNLCRSLTAEYDGLQAFNSLIESYTKRHKRSAKSFVPFVLFVAL